MHRIVEWLENKRREENMQQGEFALRSNLLPSYYSLLCSGKRGKRGIGEELRKAIKAAHPDMPDSLFLPQTIHNQVTEVRE